MVNKFIDSITTSLFNEFGESYTYYMENVEQNFKKPCFKVDALNPLIRSIDANRYKRTMPIVIHFFTDKESTINSNRDNYSIVERIMQSLEFLEVDRFLFRGEQIEYTVVEGVLEFFITYDFYTTKEQEEIYMQTGTLNGVLLRKDD